MFTVCGFSGSHSVSDLQRCVLRNYIRAVTFILGTAFVIRVKSENNRNGYLYYSVHNRL